MINFVCCLTLQLLVEYDDQSWDQREWINVHHDDAFHVLLVENDLWWAPSAVQGQHHGDQDGRHQLWPALVREQSFSNIDKKKKLTSQLPSSLRCTLLQCYTHALGK